MEGGNRELPRMSKNCLGINDILVMSHHETLKKQWNLTAIWQGTMPREGN